MDNKKQYFYVLLCKDNSFYGGYTTDLTRRLKEHNEGTGAKYTHPKSRRHLILFTLRSLTQEAKQHRPKLFLRVYPVWKKKIIYVCIKIKISGTKWTEPHTCLTFFILLWQFFTSVLINFPKQSPKKQLKCPKHKKLLHS